MTEDDLKSDITKLRARVREFKVRTPESDRVTLLLADRLQQLADLTPEPEAALPAVDDVVSRARKRGGLERLRSDLHARLAAVPEGAPSTDQILDDLLAVRASLTDLDASEGAS
jgi:hypothetical protein